MRKKLRAHVTYANVAATLALFMALSTGGAYAANEWTGANIQNETLTGEDVKGKFGTATTAAVNGSLTSADIHGQAANPSNGTPFVMGSLTGEDVRDGSLGGVEVAPNTLQANHIGTDAVGTGEVTNGALQAQDFAPGVLASFRAYGRILSTTHTRSKNVVSVYSPFQGAVCIKLAAGIDPSKSAPVATPDFPGSTRFFAGGDQAIVEIKGSADDCSPGELEVVTGARFQTYVTLENGSRVVKEVTNEPSNQPFFFVLP
jgi:hypothetical protein